MTQPSSVHNAITLLARLYGEMLAEQDKEMQFLRSQVDAMQKHIVALESRHGRADSQGVAGEERERKEPLRGQPDAARGERPIEGSGEVQKDHGVGEEEGRKDLTMTKCVRCRRFSCVCQALGDYP